MKRKKAAILQPPPCNPDLLVFACFRDTDTPSLVSVKVPVGCPAHEMPSYLTFKSQWEPVSS